MKERRKFVRVKALDSVKYRIKGEDELFNGQVKDLSVVGINIFTEESIDKGIILELELFFVDDKTTIFVDGEVVWHLKNQDNRFTIGVYFINLNASIRGRLAQFIYNYASRINENREFVRTQLKTNAMYCLVDDLGRKNNATIIDISCGGMKLVLGESIDLENLIRVSFYLPKDKTIIEVVGKVVWLNQKKEKCFEIGVTFVRIKDQDKERIRDFIIQACKSEGGGLN
ncbi:MAG: PilZ domain-containing protein [Candidatus Omnitrophota bacterium]